MAFFYYLSLAGFAVLSAVLGFLAFAVFSSRLTSFNRSGVIFRVLYALFSTRLGALYFDHQRSQHRAKSQGQPHSQPDAEGTGLGRRHGVRVYQVPVMDDNVAYLIIDVETGCVAAVDPADPDTVLAALDSIELPAGGPAGSPVIPLNLTMVLCTHHHWDHAGGNGALRARFPGLVVVGGATDRVAHATRLVGHGEVLTLGRRTRITALLTPCHTAGHICFHVRPGDEEDGSRGGSGGGGGQGSPAGAQGGGAASGALFSGDALFVGGTGKFFEGSAAHMLHTLERVILPLPPSTLLFPGHEYTLSNLTYAALIEPGNEAAKSRLQWAADRRRSGLSTIPSTLELERRHNPFIRVVEHAELRERFGCGGVGTDIDSAACRRLALAVVRRGKDSGCRSAAELVQFAKGGCA